MISPDTFSKLLFQWAEENPRIYPWTGEKDPYKIWISEIILQQTRSDQAKSYYLNFIKSFPDIRSLAAATEDEVLNCWKGLGYYTRARNIKKTATVLSIHYSNSFPERYEEILSLEGIGPYTASAISSFAYNLPEAVIDGNVVRVLSRLFGIQDSFYTSSGKKQFEKIAIQYLNKKHPGKYNQALMNFGALQCKPGKPDCASCILSSYCVAFRDQKVLDLPLRPYRKTLKKRYFHFFVITTNTGDIVLEQRNGKDIWQKLYQLPLIETETNSVICSSKVFSKKNIPLFFEKDFKLTPDSQLVQKLSHQEIFARFYIVPEYPKLGKIKQGFCFVKPENLANFAFPKIIREFFEDFKLKRLC